ncbi:MAG: hypothetical protein WBJ95_03350, partial [Bacillota bacterium]
MSSRSPKAGRLSGLLEFWVGMSRRRIAAPPAGDRPFLKSSATHSLEKHLCHFLIPSSVKPIS